MQTASVARLRLLLALFVTALAIPAWLLLNHALGQLKWEAYYDARQGAQNVAQLIDSRLRSVMGRELNRDPAQYSFLLGSEAAGLPGLSQRSELSRLPAELESVPGLVGHFQVDSSGQLTAPALPTSKLGEAAVGAELEQRRAVKSNIESVLAENLLIEARESLVMDDDSAPAEGAATDQLGVSSTGDPRNIRSAEQTMATMPADQPAAPAAAPVQRDTNRFDEIARPSRQRQAARKQQNYGQVADLKLESSYEEELADTVGSSAAIDAESDAGGRAAQAMPASASASESDSALGEGLRVTAFENQRGAFRFSLLDSGHFVLFRNVWREGQRRVQGFLIDQQVFLDESIGDLLRATAPQLPARLLVAYGGSVLGSYAGTDASYDAGANAELSGELLYQSRLSPPLSDLELIFLAGPLPLGSRLSVLLWLGAAIMLVLLAGSALLYRLGLQQLTLARQQRDFVSAVSHELKTPLTSIRMYGEMLSEGLAPEDRKPEYYRFIFDESERLSRLIDNVLQLARLERRELQFSLVSMDVSSVLKLVQSKVQSRVAAAQFELVVDSGSAGQLEVSVDADAIVQIFINLVDNAIKFSRHGNQRRIELAAHAQGPRVVLALRDYGPGIAGDQLGKVFKLFYRSETELTRETAGTGIGLALVQQLALGMGGRVDVRQCQPGSEFRVSFQIH